MNRKRVIRRVREVRYSVLNGVPHDLTFKPTGKLSKEAIELLQQSLNADFRRWRESWILPLLDEIEALVGAGMKQETLDNIRGYAMAATKEEPEC